MMSSRIEPGWIYVLTNSSMPGIVKIGRTARSPKERAAELGSSGGSGLPTPFCVAWCGPVSDSLYVEQAVHRMLEDKRLSKSREFFTVDVETARRTIEAVAGSLLNRRSVMSYPIASSGASWRTLLSGLRPFPRGREKSRRRYRARRFPRRIASLALLVIVTLVIVRPSIPLAVPLPARVALYLIEDIGAFCTRAVLLAAASLLGG